MRSLIGDRATSEVVLEAGHDVAWRAVIAGEGGRVVVLAIEHIVRVAATEEGLGSL